MPRPRARGVLARVAVGLGRWLLQAVFASDAAAALDDKTKNPVWQELVRMAGGPTLKLSKHMLYVAVR